MVLLGASVYSIVGLARKTEPGDYFAGPRLLSQSQHNEHS
jgi:hypothetical protein